MGSGSRGGRDDTPSNNTNLEQRNTQISELMALEARRDFLLLHLETFEQNPTHSSSAASSTDRKAQLKFEIQALEVKLGQYALQSEQNRIYLSGIVIPKIGTDAEGISTRMANHFSQLSVSTDKIKPKPFVQLNEQGLKFYWNNPHDAQAFSAFLGAHLGQHTVSVSNAQLAQDEIPESLQGLTPDEKYQGAACMAVSIPHVYVEEVLKLAQYHSYSLKPVASDWYAAKKLDRGTLLTQQIIQQSTVPTESSVGVQLVEAVRASLNVDTDLVKVTVTAHLTSPATEPAHVVILFDDSGSMGENGGGKIKAANAALEAFVRELPDETLVSIQPFNVKTQAYRVKAQLLKQELAGDTKPKWCAIPATGGTPLCEALANSAVFLRKNPDDLTISDAAIANTTIVLLTDGQANSKAKDAVYAMQTSSGTGGSLLPSVQIPGLSADNYKSYGVDQFKCRVLPVVYPIAMGNDSDAVFMRQLADELHMPEAYVGTDASMTADINHAMANIKLMLQRVSQVFVGLGYQHNNVYKAAGLEEHNVFEHRSRDLFFTVPKTSTQLQVCFAVGSAHNVSYQAIKIADENLAPIVCKEYVSRRLTEIKVQFSHEVAALASGNAPIYSRGRGASSQVEKPSGENQQAFETLKNNTLRALRELALLTTDNKLLQYIGLFQSSVSSLENSAENLATAVLTRGQVASYTQGRMVGAPVDVSAINVSAINVAGATPFFSAIKDNEFKLARKMLRENPKLINTKSSDQFQATVLISSIARLSQDNENAELRKFVMQLLTSPPVPTASSSTDEGVEMSALTGGIIDTHSLDTTAQDAQGNTALHRAAWQGETQICLKIIAIAKENGQLDALLRTRNKVAAGASMGETVLDNIRRSNRLFYYEKQSLIRALAVALNDTKDYKSVQDAVSLNSHIPSLHWNTPIMQLMRDLRDTQSQRTREHIFKLLDMPGLKLTESNYNGDTLLHYAIWFGEFEMANKIIAKAQASGELLLLLNARNTVELSADTGGELPHMNLAEVGKGVVLAYILDPNTYAQSMHQWLQLRGSLEKHLTSAQLTECNHLNHLYQKVIAQYWSHNVLAAAPIVSLNQTITTCSDMIAQQSSNTGAVVELLKKLRAVKTNCSLATVQAAITYSTSQLTDLGARTFSNEKIFDLYTQCKENLRRFEGYLQGETKGWAPLPSEQLRAIGVEVDKPCCVM